VTEQLDLIKLVKRQKLLLMCAFVLLTPKQRRAIEKMSVKSVLSSSDEAEKEGPSISQESPVAPLNLETSTQEDRRLEHLSKFLRKARTKPSTVNAI